MPTYLVEAAEQCERLDIPYLGTLHDDSSAVKLSDLLDLYLTDPPQAKLPHLLACRERLDGQSPPVLEALADRHNGENIDVAFLVGPEGGWSPAEQALLDELEVSTAGSSKRVTNVSLGPTVLRAETACVTAVAAALLRQ